MDSNDKVREGAGILVRRCAALKEHESALVLSDSNTQHLGEVLASAARKIADRVTHLVIPPLVSHGAEPPLKAADAMLEASVVFCVTKHSLALSKARSDANRRGVRFLSLPGYDEQVLSGQALRADFKALVPEAERLAGILSKAKEAELATPEGNILRFILEGRSANSSPGWCGLAGCLASPPDAEVNIAPMEEATQGSVYIDGSVACPEIGLLSSPLRFDFMDGKIAEVQGGRAQTLLGLLAQAGPQAQVVGELGIGLNPLARPSGFMLEDEGVRGSVHLGLGANSGLGGENSVPFHLDLVTRKPTLTVDGNVLIEQGLLTI